MQHRIIHLAVADLRFDPAAAAARITALCQHHPALRPTGLCLIAETLIVPFAETTDHARQEYVFAPLGDLPLTRDEATATIVARLYAGFTLIGTFEDGRIHWALFAQAPRQPVRQKKLQP